MVAIRTEAEIKKVEKACRYVADTLSALREMIRPGLSTIEIDRKAIEMTHEFGVKPAFLKYGNPPFPASVCVSINEQIVHGIPGDRVIKDGDIVSLDFGINCDGYFGDAAYTVMVGNVAKEKKRLCEVTEQALFKGIEQAVDGARLGDISNTIQTYVESKGYSIVREFVGHGIGSSLHEDPQIPNFGAKGEGILLKSGMILAIEPMVNMGSHGVRILPDGWTAITEDGKPSAHYEHTIVVNGNKPGVLTAFLH